MNNNQYLQELGVANFEFIAKINTPSVLNVDFLILEKNANNSFCQNGASRDLLAKMLNAIAKNIDAVALDDYQNINKYSAKITLFAGEFADEKLVIPHPADILQNPNLKRDAWEVLKTLKI